jgi:hypothetical protein
MMVASRGHAENGGRKTTESNPGSSGIWRRYCRSRSNAFGKRRVAALEVRCYMGKNLKSHQV